LSVGGATLKNSANRMNAKQSRSIVNSRI